MTTSLNPDYTTNITYNSIFEFAKAQNKYYATSNVSKNVTNVSKDVAKYIVDNAIYKDKIAKHNKNYAITQDIIKEMSNMLADAIKKNHMLTQRIVALERNIQGMSITHGAYEKKMLTTQKKNEVLEEAEKNRNDKHYREQLIKYSLIMFAGFALFGLIKYL
jgi:hypothetical protein